MITNKVKNKNENDVGTTAGRSPSVGPPPVVSDTGFRDPLSVPVTLVVDTDDAVQQLSAVAADAARVALDTETVARRSDGRMYDLDVDGPGPLRVVSVAAVLSDGSERALVFDTAEGCVDFNDPRIVELCSGLQVCAWNADFDEKVLRREGVELSFWWDLMLADALLNQGCHGFVWYHGLARQAQQLLGVDVEGKGDVQLSYTVSGVLSDAQVSYAAVDAVVTLWLADTYERLLVDAGLVLPAVLECAARPFRNAMELAGVAFDFEAWLTVVTGFEQQAVDAKTRLAELTEGGQGNLFSDAVVPAWNPDSDVQVKEQLNKHFPERVSARFGRLLQPEDSADKDVLRLIGGEFCDVLLSYRDAAKVMSTYGESWVANVDADGRVRSRYPQCLTSTGRLKSNRPNMQNTLPQMKPFFRPPHRPVRDESDRWVLSRGQRVVVQADLSQAELRQLAQVSADPALREAFLAGQDMHSATAGRMFGLDVEALKSDDLQAASAAAQGHLVLDDDWTDQQLAESLLAFAKTMRGRGKTLNFAVVYGLGSQALAMSLSLAGTPTSPKEAGELLRLYLQAFPEVAEWLAARDAEVSKVREAARNDDVPFDFTATLELHRLWAGIRSARSTLRSSGVRSPSAELLWDSFEGSTVLRNAVTERLGREPSADEFESARADRIGRVVWALTFTGPKVLLRDGSPFRFESRTSADRRRLFEVSSDWWLLSVCEIVCRSKRPMSVRVRESFAAVNGVELSDPSGGALSRLQIAKVFENRGLRLRFASFAFAELGVHRRGLACAAVADRVGAAGNAFRNAPIQGGVADAVLAAFGEMWIRLRGFTDAFPVMSVHDSIMVECYVEDAVAVAEMMREVMAEGLRVFCPDVPAVVDAEICASVSAVDEIPVSVLVAEFGPVSAGAVPAPYIGTVVPEPVSVTLPGAAAPAAA